MVLSFEFFIIFLSLSCAEIITQVPSAMEPVSKDDARGFNIYIVYDDSLEEAGYDGKLVIKEHLLELTNWTRSLLKPRNRLREGSTLSLFRPCDRSSSVSYNKDWRGTISPKCQYRCSSNPKCGGATIPEKLLEPCQTTSGLQWPFNHHSTGVPNTDYILFVTYKPCESGVLAYASTCQLESKLDRPIAGYVNVCPLALKPDQRKYLPGTLKHELIHSLSFNDMLFSFYRDENGQPRTRRSSKTGLPPSDVGQFFPSSSTVRSIRRPSKVWRTVHGYDSRQVKMIVTPAVRDAARLHFGCNSLEGAELETQGDEGVRLSHWEKRLFYDELMSEIVMDGEVVSNITLALLYDSGWYFVNFDKAEEFKWGKGLGCDFTEGSCLNYIEKQKTRKASIGPFCDVVNNFPGKPPGYGCSAKRDKITYCNLHAYDQPVTSFDSRYRYFTPYNIANNITELQHQFHLATLLLRGSVGLADYCPVMADLQCADRNSWLYPKSPDLMYFGPDSMCVEHHDHWEKTLGEKSLQQFSGSGCYRFSCDPSTETMTLYSGYGQKFGECREAGEILHFSDNVGSTHYKGALICPGYQNYCPTPSTTASTADWSTDSATVTTTAEEPSTEGLTTTSAEQSTGQNVVHVTSGQEPYQTYRKEHTKEDDNDRTEPSPTIAILIIVAVVLIIGTLFALIQCTLRKKRLYHDALQEKGLLLLDY